MYAQKSTRFYRGFLRVHTELKGSVYILQHVAFEDKVHFPYPGSPIKSTFG